MPALRCVGEPGPLRQEGLGGQGTCRCVSACEWPRWGRGVQPLACLLEESGLGMNVNWPRGTCVWQHVQCVWAHLQEELFQNWGQPVRTLDSLSLRRHKPLFSTRTADGCCRFPVALPWSHTL